MGFECENCERRFYSDNAIESHCRATGHRRLWYCNPCDRWFQSEDALDKHLLHAAVHAARYDCLDCGRSFRHEDALFSHCNAKGHRWRWYCDLCEREFTTEAGLDQHCNTSSAHLSPYCDVCERFFDTFEGYEMHCANSLKHRQRANRDVQCHFCYKVFKSPSALAQHVESGVHDITRHQVTQAVYSLQVVPTITLPVHFNGLPASTARIDPWEGEDEERSNTESDIQDNEGVPATSHPIEAGPPIRQEELAPPASELTGPVALVPHGPPSTLHNPSQLAFPSFTTTEYVPADFIHLGIPYACHLCFRTFRNIFSLTTHMNSAAHDPNAFICPNHRCEKQFKLVSGLMQHVESGSCGLATKQEVYERFEKLTGRFSKLLKAA